MNDDNTGTTSKQKKAQYEGLASPTITPIDFTPIAEAEKTRHRRLRPLPLLVLGLLCIAAALLWFLLTARSVELKLSPVTSSVNISGGLSFHLGKRYLMRPGEFQLQLSAPGYFNLEQQLTVTEKDQQTYSLALKKKPGHLAVTTQPVTAQIKLQESNRGLAEGVSPQPLVAANMQGNTPLTLRDIPPGSYTLLVESARYFTQTLDLTIEGLDITQQIDIDLQPAWGQVQINSEPTGAEILLNGKSQGLTPRQVDLLHSGEQVSLVLPGYKTWQEVISVPAGEQRELPLIKLQAADGLLALDSKPQGARITNNGNYLGTTPLRVELPPDTEQHLQLYLDGYYSASRTLTMVTGEQRDLKISLKPKLGKLKIVTQPQGAQLYIDGVLKGRGNQNLSLLARPHRIEIRKAGYTTQNATVTPQPGVERLLNFTLKTHAQTRDASIPAIITAASGQKLKLFRPDTTFTLGASRREQGRRANEVLRKVKLKRPFYLSNTEVTNQQFRQFQSEHSSSNANGNTLNTPNQPVVNITWTSAARFCNWLSRQQGLAPFYVEENGEIKGYALESTGYRLPTEAEWAWAARWNNAGMLKFPWGEKRLPLQKTSNIADRSAAKILPRVIKDYNDGFAVSAPVASLLANGKGLYDMGGNVAEWVNDYYSIAVSISGGVESDPVGPSKGQFKIVRGASWRHSGMTELRLSYRDYSEKHRDDIGFRIARYAQ